MAKKHDDEAMDRKLIKKMLAEEDAREMPMKKKGGSVRRHYAEGGSVKGMGAATKGGKYHF